MKSSAKTLEYVTSGADEGRRLDRLLSDRPEIASRAAAQKLITNGEVTVDGRPRPKNYILAAGQKVEFNTPQPQEICLEPEEMDLSIPFEDEYLLVVDKPAGIVTHPAKGHYAHTLVHGLLAHQIRGGDHAHRPGIVHRLDKDTSGLMIVAKDVQAHRLLSAMLKRHEIRRTYLALAHGLFEAREGTVEAPLARHAAHRKKIAIAATRGREAVTHFRVVKSWTAAGAARLRTPPAGTRHGKGRAAGQSGAEGFSLLEVSLQTGRTHQIRVHLEAIGHPVAGDKTYGRRRDILGIGRQFLHSARLDFDHPLTGEKLTIQSPLPKELKSVLDELGG